jgi:DNA helicase IV
MNSRLSNGNVAVVCPDHMVHEISEALHDADINHGRVHSAGIDEDITVVPVSLVKGLELDGVVVVEPAAIVADDVHGLRALYVALTRSTRSLTVVHAMELPTAMQ